MHADKLSILALYIARPIILRILRIADDNNADYFAIMRKRRKLSGELIAHANITVRYCDNIAKLRNSRRGHIINYKNDKLHGLYMDSYLPDIISTLAIYDMGYKHGRSYDWYDNGALYTVIDYKRGSYSGEYYSWHANRIPLKYIRYRDGLVYGNYISWYYTGIIRDFIQYHKSLKSGYYISWYYNGDIGLFANYVDDKRHGDYITWRFNRFMIKNTFNMDEIIT